jgi:hypothetical protein
MAEDDKSAISSLIGSVVGHISSNSRLILEKGRLETLKATLTRDAAAKTVLNGGYAGKQVVKSPHIERMVAAYRVASSGRVIIMYSPADNGKTRAAEFFLHGKHPFRPDRSLMASAAAMEDFATQFSSKQLRIASVGPNLGEILCGALAHQETTTSNSSSAAAAELAATAGDVVETALCILPEKRSFSDNKEITMYGSEQIPCPGVDFDEGFPVLIIDNFNVATDKNKEFVTKLFQEASQFGVFVFILTSNESWATTLAGLNGGSKIKPLHGNVDNADYELTDPFEGAPRWNTLPWPVETLRELIRPLCEKHSIDPVKVVPEGAQMLPVTAQDRARALVMGL